jgi:hypothetical protein
MRVWVCVGVCWWVAWEGAQERQERQERAATAGRHVASLLCQSYAKAMPKLCQSRHVGSQPCSSS